MRGRPALHRWAGERFLPPGAPYPFQQFIDIVKYTYRVLLTRGMKGCYVHFMDKDTERFFKSRMT